MPKYLLALDQGTTSSRAMLFDQALTVRGMGQLDLPQHFPAAGLVEHDAEDLWRTTLEAARIAIAQAAVAPQDVAAVGITNQRETTIVWDRRSGKPIHRAIVWQDRRTADQCRALRDGGIESVVTARTGLLLDPYFSATKIGWLLDNVPGARADAEAGHLAFGTVDTWLLWRLTNGSVHATDATNASRTSLFDIHRGQWDTDMLRLFRVPAAMLPEVKDCQADFGVTAPEHFGAAIPILGIAGDQQAATMGQACFERGMLKATYGTGCFALLNTGAQPVTSRNRLLTTIALPVGGPAHVRAGRRYLRRRRRRAVAPRRPRHPGDGSRDRRPRGRGRPPAGRHPRARLRRPGRAPLAARRPRRPLRPDTRHHQT